MRPFVPCANGSAATPSPPGGIQPLEQREVRSADPARCVDAAVYHQDDQHIAQRAGGNRRQDFEQRGALAGSRNRQYVAEALSDVGRNRDLWLCVSIEVLAPCPMRLAQREPGSVERGDQRKLGDDLRFADQQRFESL